MYTILNPNSNKVQAGNGWEDQLCGMKSMAFKGSGRPGRRDSIEEDSIFRFSLFQFSTAASLDLSSLGKIVMSPRYSQYPDLSDDDSPGDNLATQQPLSLPHLRPGDHLDHCQPQLRPDHPQFRSNLIILLLLFIFESHHHVSPHHHDDDEHDDQAQHRHHLLG